MLRVDDIRSFLVVGDAGSLVAASQKLGVSQATLSKAMARLERNLGAQLLERRARGVALTDVGQVFLDHVRTLDVGLQDAIAAVRDMRHGVSGTVKIGLGFAIPNPLVVASCRALMARKRVSLEIYGGMTDSLLRQVVTGEIDFAISGIRPSRSEPVAWVPLFEDPLIPIAPATNHLASSARVSWLQLAGETWVVPSGGTSTRAWFDRQFTSRRIDAPRCVIGTRNYPRAFDLGLALDAISLVPASALKTPQDLKGHVALRVPPDWASDRVVGILYRKRGYLSPAADHLMRAFLEEARKLRL
jgi:DNA-binding transcriptional LysR family regulator